MPLCRKKKKKKGTPGKRIEGEQREIHVLPRKKKEEIIRHIIENEQPPGSSPVAFLSFYSLQIKNPP